MQVYAQHFQRQSEEVQQRWKLPEDGGSAVWGTGSELVQGFAEASIAESEIPDGVAGDSTANTEQMLALSESDESNSSVEKPTRYVPPKDALVKLLRVEHDRDAVRKNSSGLQYTTMTAVPEMEWEPVSLEEAYETAMRGMEANYSKIKTWGGECRELIIDQLDRQMKEKSHLVRFEWEVQTSKGGAVKTTSVKPELLNVDEEPIFREDAVFYTPFFFGRQNVLHWKEMEDSLLYFRRDKIPESRRFILAYRAVDRKSGLWKFESVYRGNNKLLVSQIISELHGYNVVHESRVIVLPNGKTVVCDDLLQSYSETDGVFVPSERLKREFDRETGTVRLVHSQKITRSVVNQPLQPLPVLVPEAPILREFRESSEHDDAGTFFRSN
jgi:hypothetical protein